MTTTVTKQHPTSGQSGGSGLQQGDDHNSVHGDDEDELDMGTYVEIPQKKNGIKPDAGGIGGGEGGQPSLGRLVVLMVSRWFVDVSCCNLPSSPYIFDGRGVLMLTAAISHLPLAYTLIVSK